MAGYTRSYNKSTGNTIEASDFNSEFQAIDDAFDVSSGHNHDGSSDNGAYVPKIYDPAGKDGIETDGVNHEIDFNINVSGTKTRQIYLADGVLAPNTDSDIDLGTASLRFANIYADAVDIGGNAVLDAGGIGVTVQAYDATLDNLASLTPTDKGVVIGNGSAFVVESGSTLRTSIGAQEALDVVSQAEAEAGTATIARLWTAERVAQAIAELTPPAGTSDIAAAIFSASSKATPVDDDAIGITDSATSNSLKKLTWANLKATMSSYLGYMAHLGRASVEQIRGFTGDAGVTSERLASAAAPVTISGSSNITLDWASFVSGDCQLTGNHTLSLTNVMPGTYKEILFYGNNSTTRTLTFSGSNWKGYLPVVAVTNSEKCLVGIRIVSATEWLVSAVEF